MNKTVKISLLVGGIVLTSYLLYKYVKKPATTTTEEKSNASGRGRGLNHPVNCRKAGGIPDGIGGCEFPAQK
jgi:hypothetical protein